MFRFRLHWLFDQGRRIKNINTPTTITLDHIGDCEVKQITEDGDRVCLTGPAEADIDFVKQNACRVLSGLILMALKQRFSALFKPLMPPPIIFNAGMDYFHTRKPDIDTLYRDRLGLSVYQEIGNTKFLLVHDAKATIASDAAIFARDFPTQEILNLSERNLNAYELYASSRFEASMRARFLLLIMSIETLAIQDYRPKEERDLIDALIRQVEETRIGNPAPLLSGLNNLKKLSIGYSCRKLIDQAIVDGYVTDVNASKHFTSCYRLRGTLVHEGASPGLSELTTDTIRLETIASELLAWSFMQGEFDLEAFYHSDYVDVLLQNSEANVVGDK